MPEGVSGLLGAPARVAKLPPILVASSVLQAVPPWQFRGRFGGMVAFEVCADQASTLHFVDALELVVPGTSLGDVESLILYPALSSHRTLTSEERAAAGIGETLLRMSVGLESSRDLTYDLACAAAAAGIAEGQVTGIRS